MKTLLVQQSPTKFIQNTIYTEIEDVKIIGLDTRSCLYKTFYTIKPDYFLIRHDMLDPESMQFMHDFHNSVKIILYHDTLIESSVSSLPDSIYHIYKKTTNNFEQKDRFIQIPHNLVNTSLYKNKNLNNLNGIVFFLDKMPVLPEFMNSILFPNSNIPIKMFNNPQINHPQNLGLINEHKRAEILQKHKYYLTLDKNDDDYITEAKICGCAVVTVQDIENYSSCSYEPSESYNEYSTFLKERILI